MMRGSWLMRPMSGMRKQKIPFRTDFSGVVEALEGCYQRQAGRRSFWREDGAVAEYVCVKAERAIVMKPNNVTFEQAARLRLTASQHCKVYATRDAFRPDKKFWLTVRPAVSGRLRCKSQSVWCGGQRVCSTRNVDLVKSIGADHRDRLHKRRFTQTINGTT